MRDLFSTTIFACVLTCSLFLAGCSSEDPIQERESPGIALDKDKGTVDCSGEILFTPILTVIPVYDYPGYDLAIQITGSVDELPAGCACVATTYTLSLNVGYNVIQEVGVTSSIGNTQDVEVVYENVVGFLQKFLAPEGRNENPSGTGSNNYTVSIEATDGDIVLFDFYGGVPGGTNSMSAIESAGGICIVDNIGKSNP